MIYSLKYILCILIVLGSCTQHESSRSEMININATVEKIIKAYIQSMPIILSKG